MEKIKCNVSQEILKSKRIVVKIGSSLITKEGSISPQKIAKFVAFVASLIKEKREIIIVSSGAIASARASFFREDKEFYFKSQEHKKIDIVTRQALASIGQVSLMEVYRKAFAKKNLMVGQILFSKYSIQHRKAYLNARNTISRLLSMGVVPIINENDPLAIDEIRFGDNDVLGALSCGLMQADLYLIFSNVDGFYLDGCRLDFVEKVTDSINRAALGSSSIDGTGGMITKLNAVKLNYRFSIPTFLTNGMAEDLYENIFKNPKGTFFSPKKIGGDDLKKISPKKCWILAQSFARGKIFIDFGATEALFANKSLLAEGITQIEGNFHTGDVVDILGEKEKKLAQGLTHFDYKELAQILGHASKDFEKILGYKVHEEVVHRNNLVFVSEDD